MEMYLIKTSITLTGFYIIYWMFVRHNYAFNTNRMIILFCVLSANLLPFLHFDLNQYPSIHSSLEPIVITDIVQQNTVSTANTSMSIFSIVYIVGLMVFAIRSGTGLATLYKLFRRSPKKNYHGFNLVILEGNQAPFTFFNLLFIGKKSLGTSKMDEIIIHEKAHQDHWHTLDLLIMEVMTIIYWFNPVMWLFKSDLKSEHEFLADEQVLKKGIDLFRYQKMLLQTNLGHTFYLGNYFNYSTLKKRLKMMKQENSNRKSKIKYALTLPSMAVGIALLLFSFQSSISIIPDQLPEYSQGMDAFYRTIQRTIKYPLEARKSNAQGTIYISFTVDVDGNIKDIKSEKDKYNLMKEIVVVAYRNEDTPKKKGNDLSMLENEGERIIASLGKFKAGEKDGMKVETRMTLPITFKMN